MSVLKERLTHPAKPRWELACPRSTGGRAVALYWMPLLAHLDQATGMPERRPRPVRYEHDRPGGLIHIIIGCRQQGSHGRGG
jgi:hypothetical protein